MFLFNKSVLGRAYVGRARGHVFFQSVVGAFRPQGGVFQPHLISKITFSFYVRHLVVFLESFYNLKIVTFP